MIGGVSSSFDSAPLFLAALGTLLLGCSEPAPTPVDSGLTVAEAMGGDATDGYARAVEPGAIRFPRDHGPHPGFRTEWWYVTGNLESAAGERFGFQVTLFRNAVAPEMAERSSDWATRQVWMGHLGLTDGSRRRFHSRERFARGAAGLAGAELEPFRVWLEDWELRADPERASEPAPEAPGADWARGLLPLTLRVADGDEVRGPIALDLVLEAAKRPVLQGDRGLSKKGSSPGNASYYYSMTRLPTRGRVTAAGRTVEVEGASWLDREWSTSALEDGQVGWDWFALQLGDGRDLMLYRMRRGDGSLEPLSRGSLVEADGSSRVLSVDAFEIEPLELWTSPRSGGEYPVTWRVRVPEAGIDLAVEPVLRDQEHETFVVYWEGAVDVRGTSAGEPVEGVGYVELTGYADGGTAGWLGR